MFDDTSSLTMCKDTISSIVFECHYLTLGPNGLTEFCDCLHDCSLFVGRAMYVFYTDFHFNPV